MATKKAALETGKTTVVEGANVPAQATPQGGAVALPESIRARLMAQAQDVAAKERPSVAKISLRGGVITYMGNPVKGGLPVVILFAAHRNTYYGGPFDPNNLANPDCFAISLDGEDMQAHENVKDEQLPGKVRDCDNCPLAKWGSDPRPGSRGKACKETRRLVVMPAGALQSVEAVGKAELAIIDLPVTSSKNYSNYVNTVATAHGVPQWCAITEITTEPDAKTQFKVRFEVNSFVLDEGDIAILDAVEKRIEDAKRIAMVPYDEVGSTEEGKMKPGEGVAKAPAQAKKAKF